jgi:NAD-dependent SIR2 family protein deacetylase
MGDHDTVAGAADPAAALDVLTDVLARHRRLMVLTGAGCSTASGIPAYRDRSGEWAHPAPIQAADFIGDRRTRRRYWARSYAGWPRFAAAAPSPAHEALAALDRADRLTATVTQNVDGLHTEAGSRAVIDLHGRLDTVVCLDCRQTQSRASLQQVLEARNPGWAVRSGERRPDGDVEVDGEVVEQFDYPDCGLCGGVLKPDVVFFGESVPRPRVQAALEALEAADALLVVGSSLMVWSGYRFVRRAIAGERPVIVLNAGRTRADDDDIVKLDAECGGVLSGLVDRLRC